MKRSLLIAMFGHPGSGKTFFSERLARRERYFHLAADKVRLAMFEKPRYTPTEHRIVFRFMDYLAEEFLKHGVSVIYDANFNLRKYRKKLERLTKRVGARYQLVWVQTNEEVAVRRLGKRSKLKSVKRKELYRPIDFTVFKRLKGEMEFPTKAEAVVEIDGHAPFFKQLASFRRQTRF